MKELKSEPIGANGMLYVLKDANRRFEGKLSGVGVEGAPAPSQDTGKLTITETDVIKEPCRVCDGEGYRSWGIGKEGECRHCHQRGYYEYRFPREIVKLANKLAHQDALTIARTLAGLKLGFKL